MKKIILLVWWVISVSMVLAQSGFEVKGVVVDSLSDERLPYVRVGMVTGDTLQSVVAVEFTGEDGLFSIKNVSEGDYFLKLFLMGYDMPTVPIAVHGDKVLDLGTFALKKQSRSLDAVTVEAQKPVYMFDGEKTLYNVSEDPMVQNGTASDALQNAPGVEVDVEGNITLRGVSSVEIWINNKPSNMNEAALKNFIKEMPAGSIEKIEVITNPSARYSAKGKGGVINIVTNTRIKKNNFFSFGMSATTMPTLTPWLSYVWANEKWSLSVYAQYSYSISRFFLNASDAKLSDDGDTASVTGLHRLYRSPYHTGGLFFNGSCQIDSANTLYMWAGAYPGGIDATEAQSESRREYIDMAGRYDYVTVKEQKTRYGGGYAGLWFSHQFNDQGHEISANASGNFYGTKMQGEDLRFCPQSEGLNFNRKHSSQDLSYTVNAGLDYTVPYHPDGEIGIGTNALYSSSSDLVRYDTLQRGIQEGYVLDSLRYKDAHLDGAGWDFYVTLQHRFGRFTLKGGLRSEYVFYNLRYANSPKDNGLKHYWGLYPSLHLTYTTKSMDNFKLSYTRRVSNPDAEELTTFVEYDDDSYSVGNPLLRPAYTNAVEAGWTRFIPKFGNIGITAYFNNTKDEYNSLMDVAYNSHFGRIVSFSMPVNAGKSLNTGAELNVTYQLKAFMSLRFYATLQYMQSQFTYRDEVFKVNNLGYQFRLNFWAKVWKVLEINLSANYRSKSRTLFITERPYYTLNGGLRVELWKRLLALHVNVNNIFNWNRNGSVSDNPYYSGSTTYLSSWSGRHIALGITFRFGKLELESQAARGNVPTGEGMPQP